MEDFSIPPLPCPRCGSNFILTESHPSTGPLVECRDCGACSYWGDWRVGQLHFERVGKYRRGINEIHARTQAKEGGEHA